MLSVLLITGVYALVIFGPNSYSAKTDAICFAESREPVATFTDMNECVLGTSARDDWRYCTCSAQQNTFAQWYYFLGVPLAFTSAAVLITAGTMTVQLILLNSAVVSGGLFLIAFYIYRGSLYEVGVPFSVLGLCLLSVSSSTGLVLVRWIGRQMKGRRIGPAA